jgi:hypothetical protein
MTVLTTPRGEILFSYSTPVAACVPGVGFVQSDFSYSSTTTKHIKEWVDGARVHKVPQSEIDALLEDKTDLIAGLEKDLDAARDDNANLQAMLDDIEDGVSDIASLTGTLTAALHILMWTKGPTVDADWEDVRKYIVQLNADIGELIKKGTGDE